MMNNETQTLGIKKPEAFRPRLKHLLSMWQGKFVLASGVSLIINWVGIPLGLLKALDKYA